MLSAVCLFQINIRINIDLTKNLKTNIYTCKGARICKALSGYLKLIFELIVFN